MFLEHLIRESKADVVLARKAETVPPKAWAEPQLRAWLHATVARGSNGQKIALAAAEPRVPKGVGGKAAMAMTVLKLRNVWGLPDDLAAALFAELRVATKAADAANKAAARA